MLLAEKWKCKQKWNTIFYINWDFETQILLDLIASSKAKGQLYQEPNNVSRISYSPYPLIFEQIELIGCVKNCVASSQECVKQLVCAQFLKLVSAAQGRGGGTNLSGKANFLLHLIMIHLVTEILEQPVSEEADVKVMQFHSTRGQVT